MMTITRCSKSFHCTFCKEAATEGYDLVSDDVAFQLKLISCLNKKCLGQLYSLKGRHQATQKNKKELDIIESCLKIKDMPFFKSIRVQVTSFGKPLSEKQKEALYKISLQLESAKEKEKEVIKILEQLLTKKLDRYKLFKLRQIQANASKYLLNSRDIDYILKAAQKSGGQQE